MNPPTDNLDLLADVLAENSPAEFRAGLLTETLRLARRRRQFRQARHAASVVAVLALLTIWLARGFFQPLPVPPVLAQPEVPPSYQLVRTQPLSPTAWVQTSIFAANPPELATPGVSVVTTTGWGYRNLNDDELLAFLEGRPAILVRVGGGVEELVFANPQDRQTLFSN
ncbi:MAG TPA: hypothetical protein VL527_07910 [Dongiaceae bacterium]|jgi:hypothetical protein|nr:hypothetical protein [Dongiaceae bacterium]